MTCTSRGSHMMSSALTSSISWLLRSGSGSKHAGKPCLSSPVCSKSNILLTLPLTIKGFFGMMPTSMLQSVGRGYSDLCAAMCAVSTFAAELQIWKEVDGIFTADPRKVPSARLLATVTLEEASELTYYGSEVGFLSLILFTLCFWRNTSFPPTWEDYSLTKSKNRSSTPSQCNKFATPTSLYG